MRKSEDGRRLAPAQQRRDFDQGLEHVDAHDARAAKKGIHRGIAAGECAGVRARERLAQGRTAEFVGDHGLARGMRARCGTREGGGIAHGF